MQAIGTIVSRLDASSDDQHLLSAPKVVLFVRTVAKRLFFRLSAAAQRLVIRIGQQNFRRLNVFQFDHSLAVARTVFFDHDGRLSEVVFSCVPFRMPVNAPEGHFLIVAMISATWAWEP